VLCMPSAPPDRTLADRDLGRAFATIYGARATGREMEHTRRSFAADADLWRSMPHDDQPITVPIVAFLGAGDTIASEAGARTLESITTSDFSLIIVPGDHFYLHQEAPRRLLLAELRERAESALSSRRDGVRRRSTLHVW